MPKECAVTATTNMGGLKNLGTVLMVNFTPTECAKIATLTPTIAKEGRKEMSKMRIVRCKVN